MLYYLLPIKLKIGDEIYRELVVIDRNEVRLNNNDHFSQQKLRLIRLIN